jgi:transcriptional regulator of acetoin/glycerol metabolism
MKTRYTQAARGIVGTIGVLLICAVPALAQAQTVARFSTQADFDSVKEEILLAIQGRGLVVDHTSYIGNMLDRTAKDLGGGKRIYAKAEAVQFCSAAVSRRMMEADSANIAFCPYVIALYVRADDPKTVHAVFRRVSGAGSEASRASLAEVDALLEAIVKEAGLK